MVHHRRAELLERPEHPFAFLGSAAIDSRQCPTTGPPGPVRRTAKMRRLVGQPGGERLIELHNAAS